MISLDNLEVWFVTGSQSLYGQETLDQVALDARKIVDYINASKKLCIKVVYKPTVTTPESIYQICQEANSASTCVGIITWMHTFSPAKMWIAGLKALQKPMLDFHTQFNRDIPWNEIDMDYMNLNQTAHGGREFGFIGSRIRNSRKVVVGYWQDSETLQEIDVWLRAAAAWHDSHELKIARFGDNMRDVAVTDGDKVAAQMDWGYSVNGYGMGDLAEYIQQASTQAIKALIDEYYDSYTVADNLRPNGEFYSSLEESARIEAGMRAFLEAGSFKGFTTTFENLHGVKQLPGLAVQRLMADGYGFGAEGDWKTAALVRTMKVMAAGLPGGTSFMEDYTYHMEKPKMQVLGAHMLEVCPSIASAKPSLEIHPLSIGSKADPVRLVFNVAPAPAIVVSVIDMGNRFRMIVNTIDVIKPASKFPKLPVARALWIPDPDLKIGATAWMLAGGAHHTGFSMAINETYMEDYAEIAGVEYLLIGKNTELSHFKQELRWNDMFYHFAQRI
jgi:L-arabinose isomerase